MQDSRIDSRPRATWVLTVEGDWNGPVWAETTEGPENPVKGHRLAELAADADGGINDLTSQQCSDVGGGAIFHESLVAVEAAGEGG